MGKASRVKGARWEVEVARRFREIFPGLDIQRGLAQARNAREEPDVAGVPLLWIECKCGRHTYPHQALKQATAAAPPSKIPLVVSKDDRQPPAVTLALEDFEWFLRQWVAALQRAGAGDFPPERVEEPRPQPQLELVPPVDRDAWGNP